MKKEHPGADHTWACRVIEGAFGEVTLFRVLPMDAVGEIDEGSVAPEDLCPTGQIVCLYCEQLFRDERDRAAEPIDFVGLRGSLTRRHRTEERR